MLRFLPLLVAAGFLTGCADFDLRRDGPSPALRATIDAHLAAIQSRDLDALLDTITSDERLTLILPDGRRSDTRAEYVAFHERWFADDGWTMTFEPVRTVESPGLATALFQTTYEAGGPAERHAYLALTFADAGDGWRLVLGQNTHIEPAE